MPYLILLLSLLDLPLKHSYPLLCLPIRSYQPFLFLLIVLLLIPQLYDHLTRIAILCFIFLTSVLQQLHLFPHKVILLLFLTQQITQLILHLPLYPLLLPILRLYLLFLLPYHLLLILYLLSQLLYLLLWIQLQLLHLLLSHQQHLLLLKQSLIPFRKTTNQ